MSLSKRVTVMHTESLKVASQFALDERTRFPEANVSVQGEQGAWTVRRDRLPDETEVACRTSLSI